MPPNVPKGPELSLGTSGERQTKSVQPEQGGDLITKAQQQLEKLEPPKDKIVNEIRALYDKAQESAQKVGRIKFKIERLAKSIRAKEQTARGTAA